MHPYLFETEFFSLRWENIMIVLGIAAGVWLSQRRSAHKGLAYQNMLLDLSLWLVLGGIAGARIWEMLFTFEEYAADPWAMLAIWEGGLSIQGAVLGGLIVAILFARRRKVRVWEMLDIIAPSVILGQAIGRIGCFLSGDAFGRPISEVPWLPSLIGATYAPRTPAWYVFGPTPLVPAELFEMFLGFGIFAFLLLYKPRREMPGRITLTYAVLYSMVRFGLEFLRGDSLMFGPFKSAQALSLIVILVCGLWLFQRYRQQQGPTARAAG